LPALAPVAAAEVAAVPYGRSSYDQRAALVRRVADLMEARFEEFALAESRDSGKPVALTRMVDIPRAVHNLRFFADAASFLPTAAHHMDPPMAALNYTERSPLGVVGLITPWNLPLYLLTWKVAPALMMGNTIVAKPSEVTPTTATMLAELVAEVSAEPAFAGYAPAGLLNVVHGLGPEAGQALVADPKVKAVSFTGGTVTGAMVGQTAAARFAKASLELGGKNACVVFADARENFEGGLPDLVKRVTRAAYLNSGQICLCGSRVFVERALYDEFVAELTIRVGELVVGDPHEPTTNLGPLVSQEHRAKVESYIALARDEGGVVLTGGERPAGLPERGAYLRPTLIEGLSPVTSRAATEEIFGPVVTVHPFDTEDEVVSYANGVDYGLCASVWTSNLDRAHRVSSALDVGMVWVNTWLHRDLRTPFGGVKASGVGREGGNYSLEFFSETKNVCIALGLDSQPKPRMPGQSEW